MWLFWLSLLASVIAIIASLVFTTRRGLQLFRDLRRFSGSTAAALDEVRLDASLARLRVSQARLNVQRAAIDDVRDSLERLTSFRPRK
jgi:hypothetical protein